MIQRAFNTCDAKFTNSNPECQMLLRYYRLITKQIEVLKSNDRKYKQSKRRNMFGKSVLHKQTLKKEF